MSLYFRTVLLERMPVLDEAAYNLKKADRAGLALGSDAKRVTLDRVADSLTNGGPK
jgi:hypothetical protein